MISFELGLKESQEEYFKVKKPKISLSLAWSLSQIGFFKVKKTNLLNGLARCWADWLWTSEKYEGIPY